MNVEVNSHPSKPTESPGRVCGKVGRRYRPPSQKDHGLRACPAPCINTCWNLLQHNQHEGRGFLFFPPHSVQGGNSHPLPKCPDPAVPWALAGL
jgi:hypothetical protein